MKKGLLFAITLSFLSYASANQTFGSLVVPDNPNAIFDFAPQDDDLLITYKAFSDYHTVYKKAEGFKAFAQSEGGAWAYVTERDSQEAANAEALSSCQGYNKSFPDSYPCQLVNIGGNWVGNDNRALEILDSLPDYLPQVPIDLEDISDDIRDDIRSEDYKQALAKRIWLHQHALEVNESYFGVRLSFYLSAWSDLGKKYPPAKTLLRYAAYHAEELLFNDPKDAFTVAHEYKAINRALGREDQSAGFFRWLDKNHPKEASLLFRLFQEELIQFELFSLYNDYVSPNLDYSRLVSSYAWTVHNSQRAPQDDEEQRLASLEYGTETFIFQVSRLVAILAMHNRMDEAQIIVKKAMLELDSREFSLSLNNALEGKLPKPRS
jgi:hypothetical protein